MTEAKEDLPVEEEATEATALDMYRQFSTDKSLEEAGVEIDYGSFRVTIARAGGANRKYARTLEVKSRPYRRAIATGTMDNSVAEKMLYEVYAETIVLRWETKIGDEWHVGIMPPPSPGRKGVKKGDLLKFTAENLVQTFLRLPDLFEELRTQSTNAALFREEVQEDDAKN